MRAFYANGWYQKAVTLDLEENSTVAVTMGKFRIANAVMIPWRYQILTIEKTTCRVKLEIAPFKWTPVQSIDVDFEVVLKNLNSPDDDITVRMEKQFAMNAKSHSITIPGFRDALERSRGFLDDYDDMEFVIFVGIKKSQMLDTIEMLDLSCCDPTTNDFEILINEDKFYVSKTMLSMQSKKLAEKLEEGISSLFEKYAFLDVYVFLQMLHGIDLSAHEFNVKELIELARILEVPRVTEICKRYLVHGIGGEGFPERLKTADKLGLWDVFPRMLSLTTSVADVKAQNWNQAVMSANQLKVLTRRIFQLT